MKYFTFAALLVASSYAQILNLNSDCGRGTDSVDKIVGGIQAQKGDWGWQIALNVLDEHTCGGSLINKNWIVTAAHCLLWGTTFKSFYTFDIGYNNKQSADSWSITRKTSKIVSHPEYSETTLYNDIALIKMDAPVDFDAVDHKITPICIPDGSEDYTDRTGYVTGYGLLFTGGSVSNILRQVDVPIKSSAYCKSKFNSDNIDSRIQVCAGESGLGKDTCQGDSGGPLVVRSKVDGRWHLVGLTSFGPDPCGEGTVYTRLSGFVDWIASTVNQFGP